MCRRIILSILLVTHLLVTSLNLLRITLRNDVVADVPAPDDDGNGIFYSISSTPPSQPIKNITSVNDTNETFSSTDTTTKNNKTVLYTIAQTDRAGSQIMGMLMAHARSAERDGIYGGACVDEAINIESNNNNSNEVDSNFRRNFDKRMVQKLKLLSVLGLEHELRFACSTQKQLETGEAEYLWKRYWRHEDFDHGWLKDLRSKSTFVYDERPPGAPLQVAVHVRRGDYQPCHSSRHRHKYLPNAYYLAVLDKYLPRSCRTRIANRCNVTIYTNHNPSQSFENFEEFQKRNMTVDATTHEADVWRAFINADVLVLSKSTFSYVPAALNRNKVIAPRYESLPNFANTTVASYKIMKAAENATKKLVKEQC